MAEVSPWGECLCLPLTLFSLVLHVHVFVKWVSIDIGNDLAHLRCLAITWTNADLFSIWPSGTYFSEIWIQIWNFSFTKMHLKMAIRQFCPGFFIRVKFTDKSTSVQVMAWCHQAASHYMSQCWHSFIVPYIISTVGHNELTHCNGTSTYNIESYKNHRCPQQKSHGLES